MEDQSQYYEDLVLHEEHDLGKRLVSREEIIEFARTWDPQSFHVDEGSAGGSIFGGLSGSSLHSMCLMSQAIADFPRRIRLIAAIRVDTSMNNPLRPDDVISFTTTVVEKRRSKSRPKTGVVHERHRVLNSSNEIIIEQTSVVLVECRYASDSEAS